MLKPLKQDLYSKMIHFKNKMDQKVWNAIDLNPDCAIRNKLREPLSTVLFFNLINDLWDTLKEERLNSLFSFELPLEHLAEPQRTDASAQSPEGSG